MSRSLRVLLWLSLLALAVLVAAATGGRVATFTGYDGAAHRVLLSDWWTLWAIPPVEAALIVLLGVVLIPAAGRAPPARRTAARAAAVGALATLILAVASPVAGLAQGGMFAAHMAQHVLIGAVAPLLVLLALPRAVPRAPRGGPRVPPVLLHPAVTFTAWVGSTVVWLWPAVHHQVYMHQSLWVLQQVSFFAFGIGLWAPVTERLAPAPVWFATWAKTLYMVGVWCVGLTMANVYWFAGSAFYSSHTAAARAWGISAIQDQANAGTVMMATHCFLAFGAIAVLFFRQSREDSLRQRLIEAGLDEGEVRWEVRYGDPARLARAAGVSLRDRPGID
jgi:cytochrome c oxidase assembly factor CtaG